MGKWTVLTLRYNSELLHIHLVKLRSEALAVVQQWLAEQLPFHCSIRRTADFNCSRSLLRLSWNTCGLWQTGSTATVGVFSHWTRVIPSRVQARLLTPPPSRSESKHQVQSELLVNLTAKPCCCLFLQTNVGSKIRHSLYSGDSSPAEDDTLWS